MAKKKISDKLTRPKKLTKEESLTIKQAKKRLEELRKELRKECISYGELAELQSLAKYIDPSDVELLEPAGVPEFPLKKYIVSVCRIGYSFRDIEVEAEDMIEAERIALDEAGGYEFSEKDANYESNGVTLVEEK